jgi:hypothetical protein
MANAAPSPTQRPSSSASRADQGVFPETSWTLIERIVQERDTSARLALGELLRRYQHAIRLLVQRRGPIYGMTAEDMHQEFLLHLATPLPNGDSRFTGLDPVNGRFRHWLSKAIANKLSNVRRHAINQRLDRTHLAGSEIPESCEVVGQQIIPLPKDLEDDLALAEAYSYCHEAMQRLQEKEPEARFEELRAYLMSDEEPLDRTKVSGRLGIRKNTLTKSISRLRSRFIRELTQITAERLGSTLHDPCLDPLIQRERQRILQLLITHPWAPKAERP